MSYKFNPLTKKLDYYKGSTDDSVGGVVDPAQWDDLVESGLGTRLDSASGSLHYNYPLKGIDFDDDTLTSDNADKIHFGYQIYHRFKLDGNFNPHIHWIQSQAATPNWWIRWRVWRNGETAGAWTQAAWDTQAFPYTSGTIMQITGFPDIDLSALTGGSLNVSDFIDIELTRDSNNSSTLFAGSDPVSGAVTARGFDPHLEVDAAGSTLEYVK